MKKILFLVYLMLFLVSLTLAQNKRETQKQDSSVMKDIFEPMLNEGSDPDWNQLKSTLIAKYNAAFAERFTWKAKIYYDYSRDWTGFTAALVHYTDTYEDHNDLKLLNKNAGMVLKYSTDKKELETALNWSNLTLDKDPANTEYKKTYDALTAKIAGN